ncbi:MAG: class I SAM-dependent methyltransferase, partial [Desulfosalsimonadaceae bacterium]|nr:class I SAM-dependent methyltransferase [Desulfosalsimonadaceae bacterium]
KPRANLMKCRHCGAELEISFLDLGVAPPSNAYLSAADLRAPEKWYPLRVMVCGECRLVQTEDYTCADELFRPDYAYFSSTSTTWLEHAAAYCAMIRRRLSLNGNSMVIEVASNDGYLLKNFVAGDIPCLGIEPTDSTADAAERLGVPVLREFFGEPLGKQLASENRQADLIIGNNVYAHVPDINDFTAGLKAALKHGGTVTLDFPHLMNLIVQCQFDTVYHEHFSYLSLCTVDRVFAKAGLRIYDVEKLPTHGGSLRVYGCHADDLRPASPAVNDLLEEEGQEGLRNMDVYRSFQGRADKIKDDLLMFLIGQKRLGKSVVAYGAAAKGNTLLNYAGIKPDLLPFVCDAAPSKQGKFLPGSHIPIFAEDVIKKKKPDIILILPWNISNEIVDQLSYIRKWDGKFAVAVPALTIC